MGRLVEDVFRACTRRGAHPRITGTTVKTHAKAPFLVWCEAFAPPSERDPPNAFMELLATQGNEHERRIVARDHPGVEPLRFATEEEGFRAALEAMARGAETLVGPPLLYAPEGLGGRADVLLRDDSAPSLFGAHHYRVKEIKLARRIKAPHRLQASFYNHLLGLVQGHTPRTFTLVDRDGHEMTFDHDEAEIRDEIAKVRAVLAGERVAPEYGKKDLWPWQSYNDRLAIEADDVTLVPGVGTALRGTLVAAGLATVRALAAAREEQLLGLPGIGLAKRKQFPVAAKAIASGAHIPLARVDLPEAPVEYFLDLEGTSELLGDDEHDPIDYLIGVLERRPGATEYHSFVAHDLDAEGTMLRAFLDWLEAHPDVPLYHWTHYEATHLRKMAERHGLDDRWRLQAPRLHDLHKDAKAAFAFPTYSLSIKQVAPYVGFHWRHKDVNAMESIAYYLAYVRDPVANRGLLDKVLDYNHDDCLATLAVKDWLVAQAKAQPSP